MNTIELQKKKKQKSKSCEGNKLIFHLYTECFLLYSLNKWWHVWLMLRIDFVFVHSIAMGPLGIALTTKKFLQKLQCHVYIYSFGFFLLIMLLVIIIIFICIHRADSLVVVVVVVAVVQFVQQPTSLLHLY